MVLVFLQASTKTIRSSTSLGKRNHEIDDPKLEFIIVVLEPHMMRNKLMTSYQAPCCYGPRLYNSRREKTKTTKSRVIVLSLSFIGLEKKLGRH